MTEELEQKERFNFDEHSKKAREEYEKIRSIYESFSKEIRDILKTSLENNKIKVHSVEPRAKPAVSLAKKASQPSDSDPNKPKYEKPILQITDLAGVRVITFFPKTIIEIDKLINNEFDVVEKIDKSEILIKEEKFGYQGVHYIIKLKDNRLNLSEYQMYKGLVAEIQVKTILQHAWAEIQHDIQYKAVETIPQVIRRRFMSLAGLLEIADREFQVIQLEDEKLTKEAKILIQKGKLEEVKITPSALRTYLDIKLEPDDRVRDYSYEYMAKQLVRLGFSNIKQVDDCIKSYDDDKISRILWYSRLGQISRFEGILIAGMGENYISNHPWNGDEWFVNSTKKRLEKLKNANITIGNYNPKTPNQ